MEITYNPKTNALNLTFKKGVVRAIELAPEII